MLSTGLRVIVDTHRGQQPGADLAISDISWLIWQSGSTRQTRLEPESVWQGDSTGDDAEENEDANQSALQELGSVAEWDHRDHEDDEEEDAD